VVTWVFRNYVLARFLSFLPDQLTEKRDQEFIYWMEMDKKRKKALQFDNGRHWQHVLINDRFSEKASKHHSTVSIHPYVCALVQRWKQQQALRCTTPHVKRSSYTSSVYESEKKTEQQQDERMKAILCTMYIQVATRCCFVLQQEIMPVIFCQRLS